MTEDRVWVFQTLTRNAQRWGRTFVVFVMSAIVVLVIAGGQCACNGQPNHATADAAAPVYHECVTDAGAFEVTCGSADAVFCSREGGVMCDLPDAGPTACCRR